MEEKLTEDEPEYISMIDFAVCSCIREIVCRVVSDKVGIPYPDGRKFMMELLKDEREKDENIRVWMSKNL